MSVLLGMMNEKHDRFEWAGERFEVKPMNLTRIVMSNLTVDTTIVQRNSQLEPYQDINNLKVTIDNFTLDESFLTPEVVQKELKVIVNELAEKWEKKFAENKAKTNQKIEQTNSDLKKSTDSQYKFLKSELRQWPHGDYCIFKGKGKKCSNGFTEQIYSISGSHLGRIDLKRKQMFKGKYRFLRDSDERDSYILHAVHKLSWDSVSFELCCRGFQPKIKTTYSAGGVGVSWWSLPFVPPPSLVGACYLHPPDARAILHYDSLCNSTCSVTGGA